MIKWSKEFIDMCVFNARTHVFICEEEDACCNPESIVARAISEASDCGRRRVDGIIVDAVLFFLLERRFYRNQDIYAFNENGYSCVHYGCDSENLMIYGIPITACEQVFHYKYVVYVICDLDNDEKQEIIQMDFAI